MNLEQFFKDFPKAKLLQVGKDYYLESARIQAGSVARTKSLKIVEITAEDIKKKNKATTASA